MEQLRQYSEKFLQITPREQYLITISGLVVIVLMIFNLYIEPSLIAINKHQKLINDHSASVLANEQSIALFEEALIKDPNEVTNDRIKLLEKNLANVDKDLLKLTSDLINPVQMRFALMDLLSVQQGVTLVSFQVEPAQALLTPVSSDTMSVNEKISENKQPVALGGLYKHSIKIKLTGKYFKLRDYLQQLEQMSWTFFWQDFDYQLKEYPISELEVTLYSLSTKREFIGV
ncbi:hypothetical protein [Thalassotalea atypica]|uniref:hypothetical protein n=1 Tax=Thalassotalea atypica TaxID=2054316 RepID=UPI002572B8F2|nr:hypothetical protein [Thalassotalea atypica]